MIGNLSKSNDTIFYNVRPGDSISKIILRYYGPIPVQQQNAIISQIQADNPSVKNPNQIQPNQLLQISIPPQYCSVSSNRGQTPTLRVDPQLIKPLQLQWQRATPKERKMLSTLTPLYFGAGAASITMLKQTFNANKPLMADMVKNYETYKAEGITKGQYDYQRKKIITKFNQKMGPLTRVLNPTRPQSEALRISKTKGRVPTKNITQQIGRMGKVAKYAAVGGGVLTAVNLGLACNSIANTDSKLEKNQIFVEGMGGLVGGTLATATLLFFITPVGWAAALVVGVGGAAGGFFSGKGLRTLYTTEFNNLDLTSMTRVDQLCKK